ncbi:MAG: TIGR03435 family protein [Acidobacteriaceae bacterium]
MKHLPLLLCSLTLISTQATTTHAQTAQAPQHPTFEVATIRESPPDADPNTGSWSPPNIGRFFTTHLSLDHILQLAYGINNTQIANKPAWLDTNLYDIEAKPEPGIRLSREELRPRLQALLQQRFHLVAHMETRPNRGYALLIAKGGPHLTPTKGDHFPGFRTNVSPGEMRGFNWSMPILAKYLTDAAGFPVLDQTNLSGSYDIAFSYEPNPDANPNSDLPPLPTALKQSTGLLLKPQTIPVENLVIDSIDKTPTPN